MRLATLFVLVSMLACSVGGGRPGGQLADAGVDATAVARDASVAVDAARPVSDAEPEVCTDVIDVVFALDVSSSMNFVLDQLEEQIPQVVTAANALAPNTHFGFVGYADNHAFAENGAEGVVHTDAQTLQAAFRQYQATYTRNNRNPGDGANGPTTQNPICEENSLDALYAAAEQFPWREHSTRVVIVATDDTFIEPPDNYGDRDHDGDWTSTNFPREGNYPARYSLAQTVDSLKAKRIRVFSFTRLTPPNPLVRCGTPRRFDWSQITNGWSAPYQGAEPIPAATDGSNFDLVGVQQGSINLADTINQVVVDSYCNPPLI